MSGPSECVVIGTTNHCNARCVFCFRERLTRPQGFMADSMFERIVGEHPAKHYNLCLFGDPLIDKQLPERVEHVRMQQPQAVVTFNTNGGLLSEGLGARLVDAGLSAIFVSVYGITAEDHDRLQPPTRLEHIVAQVRHLRALGLPVWIVCNRVEQLPGWNWERIVAFWHDHGCEVISDLGFEWGDGLTRASGTEPSQSQCLVALGYRVFDWDGSLVTCCLDYNGANNFGNINDDTWEDAVARLRAAPCTFCNGCAWQSDFDKWRNDR